MLPPGDLSTRPREPWGWIRAAGAVALTLALAVVLLPAGILSVADSGLDAGWRTALVAALVVLHLAPLPPLSTRWPVVAFGAGSAVMLLLVAAPSLAGTVAAEAGGPVPPVLLPSSFVWFVLLYGVAAHAARPWPELALAGGLVGCLITSIRLWDDTSFETSPWGGALGWRLFLLAAVLGGTLAAWSLGRFRATRLDWQAATAERAAAAERRRIAREMHDVVAHSLAVVVAQAEGGRLMVRAHPDRAPALLESIATQGRTALDQMRGLLGVLREDDAGDSFGPEPPQPGVADVPELVDRIRGTGRRVRLETFGDPRPLGPGQGLTAYRVVQEALTNVVKHAGPDASARVVLDWTDGLTITVADDGRPGVAAPGSGAGLVGMRERVEAVGGSLAHGPVAEGGWRTSARIPT